MAPSFCYSAESCAAENVTAAAAAVGNASDARHTRAQTLHPSNSSLGGDYPVHSSVCSPAVAVAAEEEAEEEAADKVDTPKWKEGQAASIVILNVLYEVEVLARMILV